MSKLIHQKPTLKRTRKDESVSSDPDSSSIQREFLDILNSKIAQEYDQKKEPKNKREERIKSFLNMIGANMEKLKKKL